MTEEEVFKKIREQRDWEIAYTKSRGGRMKVEEEARQKGWKIPLHNPNFPGNTTIELMTAKYLREMYRQAHPEEE